MPNMRLAPRWSGPPLALQIMGLLLGGLVVAQFVTLALTLLLPPEPQPQYDLGDIARTLTGDAVDTRAARPLERLLQARPPEPAGPGWLTSPRSRRELAELLARSESDVRLYFYTPLPFAGTATVLRREDERDPPARIRGEGSAPAPEILRAGYLLTQGRGGGGPFGGGPPGGGFPGPSMPGPGSPWPAPMPAAPHPTAPATPGPGPAGGPAAPNPGGGARPDNGSDSGPAGNAAAPEASPAQGPPAPAADRAAGGFPSPGPAAESADAGTAPAPRGGRGAGPPSLVIPAAPADLPARAAPRTGTAQSSAEPGSAAGAGDPTAAPAPRTGREPPAVVPAPETPTTPTAVAPTPRPPAAGPARGADEEGMPAAPARGLFGWTAAPYVQGDFVAAVRLAEGSWAVVQPRPEPFPNAWQRRVLLWFALAALLVAPLGWLFSRRIVRPLSRFADAAERLGRDPTVPTLELEGPAEVGRAAQALNRMQSRLRSFVDDRTAMIGAISHDLRTPLTRMRFRIEDLGEHERDGMLGDVDEMEHMIDDVLAFIREASEPGSRERLDLADIVEDVVEDAVFVGNDVTLERSERAPVEVDAIGMRRLFGNLIENAVKYGERAEVRLYTDQQDAVAEIADHGPGLPDDELERVFEPFYRSPQARASNKAGSGLGLAVCRSIARAHGGDVRLVRGRHGLIAQARLPLAYGAAAAR